MKLARANSRVTRGQNARWARKRIAERTEALLRAIEEDRAARQESAAQFRQQEELIAYRNRVQ